MRGDNDGSEALFSHTLQILCLFLLVLKENLVEMDINLEVLKCATIPRAR